MQVIKRDGRLVAYDPNKIIDAILAAFKEIDHNISDYALEKAGNIVDFISQKAQSKEEPFTIEEIQDLVEKGLMATKRKDVAKAYILYRKEREKIRLQNTNLMKIVKEKIEASNVQNQNANVDERSFGGRIGEASDAVMREYALNYLLSDMAKNNHLNNEIYIHDLNYYAVGCHNCFKRDTKFITSQGIKSFNDFNDGDIVTVLSPDKTWRNATVHYYGIQPVKEYILKKNKTEVSITATPNHRWILKDGSFQEGLKINDKLYDQVYFWEDFNFDDLSLEGKTYWCYGFVMGDGTLETRYSKKEHQYYKPGKSKVNLCGYKSKYLSHFQEIGYGLNCTASEPEITGINFNKTIPDFTQLSMECLISFIHGLYDAVGTQALAANTNKRIYSIQFSNKELCDFVESYFPVAGLYINAIKDKTSEQTNFGIKKYTKNYSFFAVPSTKYNWYVKDIKLLNTLEEVWCLDVEDTHAFVLENGIATGNCLSIPFDKLLANGFIARQTDVRPANSASTAFQLVAVIFQLQSLQQFG